MSDIGNRLEESGCEDTILVDGFDDAMIGVTTDGASVYDYHLMVGVLVERDGMTTEEAAEYIDYNVVRACPYYDPAPIVMFKLDDILL